jgi:alkanesulfonate monooxygenase SsuD/methylene tetrahydromethanopterin reductase-like flavin-dependent oxidoreductase (luciferase family)
MHVLNHNGPHFSVRGPLNVNRSPQGKPVLAAEAGSIVERLAEVVFTDTASFAKPGVSRQANRLTFEKLDDLGGPPDEVAKRLTERLEGGRCHGFLLQPSDVETLRGFVDRVVPLLRNRGLLRTGYENTTLREHLELPSPVHPASLERAS